MRGKLHLIFFLLFLQAAKGQSYRVFNNLTLLGKFSEKSNQYSIGVGQQMDVQKKRLPLRVVLGISYDLLKTKKQDLHSASTQHDITVKKDFSVSQFTIPAGLEFYHKFLSVGVSSQLITLNIQRKITNKYLDINDDTYLRMNNWSLPIFKLNKSHNHYLNLYGTFSVNETFIIIAGINHNSYNFSFIDANGIKNNKYQLKENSPYFSIRFNVEK